METTPVKTTAESAVSATTESTMSTSTMSTPAAEGKHCRGSQNTKADSDHSHTEEFCGLFHTALLSADIPPRVGLAPSIHLTC
jgi:hypothetical protein